MMLTLGAKGSSHPASPLRLSCLLLLLSPAGFALQCLPTQHEYENKCCSNCPPGKEMRARCREGKDTTCQECPNGWYKSGTNIFSCERCTTCSKDRGSTEVRKCTKEENAICSCPRGTKPGNPKNTTCLCPAGHQILAQECVPCQQGYFSSDNQPCRQWTNCASKGEVIEEPGSPEKDVKCSMKHKPQSVSSSVLPAAVSPTLSHVVNRSMTSGPTTILHGTLTLTTRPKDALTTPKRNPDSMYPSGFWFAVILILTILAISGVASFVFVLQRCSKKKGPVVVRTNGTNSCRIPIQEEQTDSASSLTKTLDSGEP
ncbi:tumor necrosis factor receptor superfamily member 4 [Lissotriton helveticus]